MRALKGYAKEPRRIVAYWPQLDPDGRLVSIAFSSGSLYNGTYQSWREVVAQNHDYNGPDVWWIGPDAGHVGNLSALRQLLIDHDVRRGLYGNGRGLWSVDIHKRESDAAILCLRDAAPLLGSPVPYESLSHGAATRAARLYAEITEALDTLRRQDTPIGLTLQGSGAAWVRYELIPGGRGAAQRALSRSVRYGESQMAHHVATGDDAGLAQIAEVPPWISKPTARRRPRRYEEDSPRLDAWEWTPRTDEYAVPAYFGGRVEKWADDAVRGGLYDIRSAYADAMRYPLPTKFRIVGAGDPPDDGFTIAEASVVVPSGVAVPPLPYRMRGGTCDGQVFYPTGAWDGTYTLEELRIAESLGATVKLKRWYHWEADAWMKPFVDRWWKVRKNAREHGLVTEESIAKVMLNGLYGKFAQGDETELVSTDHAAYERAASAGLHPGRIMVPVDGQRERIALYRIPDQLAAPLRHAACAAAIAARVRCELAITMNSAIRSGLQVACVNTDGMAINGSMPTGDDLGAWRLERPFDRVECLADRCVAFKSKNQWDIRAAGFGVRKRDGESETSYNRRINRAWESLVRDGAAMMEVPTGLGSGIKAGELRYTLESVRYVVKDGAAVPKRVSLPDGGTRPWSVSELRKRTGASA